MDCDLCKKRIKDPNKEALIKAGLKAHKSCYAELPSQVNMKPGPDLKEYQEKVLSEPKEETIKKHIIGELGEDNLFETKGASSAIDSVIVGEEDDEESTEESED